MPVIVTLTLGLLLHVDMSDKHGNVS